MELEFEDPEFVLNEGALKDALSEAGQGSLEGVDLCSVGQLHLDGRHITKLDPEFLNKFNILEELNLRMNRIREFPDGVKLLKMKSLDLRENPLLHFSLQSILTMPLLEDLLYDERPGRLVCWCSILYSLSCSARVSYMFSICPFLAHCAPSCRRG